MEKNNIIGVDLGGTYVRAALVRNGKIIHMVKRKTEVKKGKKQIIKNIIESIEQVNKGKIKGIGIGCPGPADYEKGKILNPPNLKPLKGVNLKKIIQKKFKIKVRMENDVNCIALAEKKFRKNKDFVVLTVGTGIGSGAVVNGKLDKGKGAASEIGHMVIDDGKDLEELASGGALVRESKEVFGKKLLAKDLVKLCKKGNKKAIKVINKNAKYLGIGLANISNIFDPTVIILAGGVKEAGNYYLNIAKKEMNKFAILKSKVVWSKIKHPGLIGAVSLFGKK